MEENTLATLVLDKCFEIHRELGPGLFESVYEKILFYELTEAGLDVQEQLILPVLWKKAKIDLGFRIDIKVENKQVAKAIIEQCEQRNITTICIGKPHLSLLKVIAATNVFNELLKKLSLNDIDLVILS